MTNKASAEYTKKYTEARPEYGKASRRVCYFRKKLASFNGQLESSVEGGHGRDKVLVKIEYYKGQLHLAEEEMEEARAKYGIKKKTDAGKSRSKTPVLIEPELPEPINEPEIPLPEPEVDLLERVLVNLS